MRASKWMGGLLVIGLIGCGPSAAQKKAEHDLPICQGDLEACKRTNADKLAKLEAKRKALEDQVVALGGTVKGLEGEKGSLSGKLEASQKELDELRAARAAAEKRMAAFRDLAAKLRSMVDSGKIKVEIRKGRMIVKLSDKILFDPGKTDLKPEGQAAIAQVTEALKTIADREFVVAGHTDNVPMKSRKFANNWELSTARAVVVVQFMIAQGMDPGHVSASGFGEFDPVGDNATEDGRATNRRIEIVVMPNVAELPKMDDADLGGTGPGDKQ